MVSSLEDNGETTSQFTVYFTVAYWGGGGGGQGGGENILDPFERTMIQILIIFFVSPFPFLKNETKQNGKVKSGGGGRWVCKMLSYAVDIKSPRKKIKQKNLLLSFLLFCI